ncbi:hypothetical protein BWQ96_02056 [Gracilariopsis chorda]|uniref:Elongator complex protein 5 n=1 Tax=Gracilariopsis chorda TaxID=448386 RepID=A0A2V3J166_9FLOR|nr:hypothetical protein BWQ96_02056 [Gracilariopsis chorda]|eukprot:PXF48104.1 hypothetical protein BWQ96_02056 [Gracilariopsis chorda]
MIQENVNRRNSSNSATLALIRNREDDFLDKGVLPAAVEYVLQEICLKRVAPDFRADHIAVISIDQPTLVYHPMSERLSIPLNSLIDGFSEWYSYRENTVSVPYSLDSSKVHIGDFDKTSRIVDNLAKLVASIFEKVDVSTSNPSEPSHRILILDSLGSLFSESDIFGEILSLVHLLSATKNNVDVKLTVIGIIRQSQTHSTLGKYPSSFDSIFDIDVTVSQIATREGNSDPLGPHPSRNFVRLDCRRRKPSGRVQFERTTSLMAWDKNQLIDTKPASEVSENKSKSNSEQDLSLRLAEHGLSFRLSLSSKEREVRAAAGLPYLHRDEKLADSALKLHPANLRLDQPQSRRHPDSERLSDDSSDESDEEELFSEDV